MTNNHIVVVELLRAQKHMQQSTMDNKIWLSVHSGNFGCDKIVHLSVHMSPIQTYITLFNFGFERFFRIFLLADVKCHYHKLGVHGVYSLDTGHPCYGQYYCQLSK